jgi:hypothetical protein
MGTREQREVIHAELQRLAKENRLSPGEVVTAAQNPDNPMHGEFNWDIQASAWAHWLHQARQLISSFTVSLIVHKKEYRIQEFVEHPTKPEDAQGYIPISTIRNSKMLAREFIDRELAIASTYVSKTADYAEILGLRDRVDGLVEDIEDLRADVNSVEQGASA